MGRKKGGAGGDPRWRSRLEPAPGDLRIIQAFVNTARSDSKGEELGSARALTDWLARWDLLSRGVELGPADFEAGLEIRAGFRSMILANHGVTPAPEVVELLDRTSVAAPIHVRVGADGSTRREPGVEGLGEAWAHLFDIFALSQRDDRWRRLKLCARDGCRAAYYDFSNARLAKWCSARCGARGSSKTYRARKKRYIERARRERLLAASYEASKP